MEQVPAATSVAVKPETVQTDVELLVRLTSRFDGAAVAVSVTDPALSGVSGGCGKMMFRVPFVTLKVLVTDAAAAKLPLADWLAVMEQVPAETRETAAPPAAVQTAVELLA